MFSTIAKAVIWLLSAALVLLIALLVTVVSKVSVPAGDTSWLEFIASITRSLALPLCALAAIGMFRSEISRVLSRIVKAKGVGFDLEMAIARDAIESDITGPAIEPLSENASAVSESANKKFSIPPVTMPPMTGLKLKKLLTLPPEKIVEDAWSAVKWTVKDKMRARGLDISLADSPSFLHIANVSEVITDAEFVTAVQLQKIYINVVIKGQVEDFDFRDALKFRDIAESLVNKWRPDT